MLNGDFYCCFALYSESMADKSQGYITATAQLKNIVGFFNFNIRQLSYMNLK